MSVETEFEQVILLAFDQAPPRSNEELLARQRALAYCEELKTQPDGWKLCLQKLHEHGGGREEIKFFCLWVITQVAENEAFYFSLPEQDKAFLRGSLLVFIRDVCPVHVQSNTMKNKLAFLAVQLVKRDFPERWPTFFTDFLSIFSRSPHVADLFLRVLGVIDEEIVEFNERRSPAEVKHNSLIKETMKTTFLPQIMAALYGVMESCQQTQPHLVQRALAIFQEYIGWIDIGLTMTEPFVGMMYSLMSSPHYQKNACDCLAAFARKDMEAVDKARVLRELKLLEAVSSIDLKQDESFVEKVAGLVNIVGVQAVSIFSNAVSMPNFPIPVPDATAYLEQTVAVALNFFALPTFEVSEKVIGFLSEYLRMLVRQATPSTAQTSSRDFGDRTGLGFGNSNNVSSPKLLGLSGSPKTRPSRAPTDWMPSPQQQTFLAQLFATIAKDMAFPPWYSFTNPDDREDAFNSFRDQLTHMFTKLILLMPDKSVELTALRVKAALENLHQISVQDMEATLNLLYLLPNSKPRPLNAEPFPSIIAAIVSSDVSKISHPALAKTYFALITRFIKTLDSQPQFVAPVLTTFMDARGMCSPDPTIRGWACYYFREVFKLLPVSVLKQLAPFLDQLLPSLQAIVQPSLSRVEVQKGTTHNVLLKFDYVVHLCEVMGRLCSSSVSGDKCRDYVGTIMTSFLQQLESGLAQKDQWLKTDPDLAGKRFSQVVSALASFTKALDSDSHLILDMLAKATETVLQVFFALPSHEMVRAKTITYMHRMVNCMQVHLAPYFNTALPVFLEHTHPTNINELLELLCQCVVVIKAPLLPFLDVHFVPILRKIMDVIQSYSLNSPSADQKSAPAAFVESQSQRDLTFKKYFTFLKDVSQSDLCPVLYSPRNISHLSPILESVIHASVEPTKAHDLQQIRANLAILRALVHHWGASGYIPEPQLKGFVIQAYTATSFQAALLPLVMPQDAAGNNVIGECIELQRTTAKLFGNDFLSVLGEYLVQFGLSNELAMEYLKLLQTSVATDGASAGNAFRDAFLQIISAKKGQSIQGKSPATNSKSKR